MAYDEKVAARIRKLIAGDERMTERKMFGGIAFMLNGNMFCGIQQRPRRAPAFRGLLLVLAAFAQGATQSPDEAIAPVIASGLE